VNVPTAGSYDFTVRAASGGTGGTFHIDMNAANVTGTQTIPGTGGWQTWTTVNVPNITLSAGVQTMKFTIDSGGYNLNYVGITGHQGPYGGSNRTIPGLIQAEDFDDGGQGVAYNDTEVTNFGGAYRTSEWVDITTTADVGGGYIVGWINTGEWMEYTVNVNNTGDHTFKIRLASCCSGGNFTLKMNNNIIANAKNFGQTGGWQTWVTKTCTVSNATGTHDLYLRFTGGSGFLFNVNLVLQVRFHTSSLFVKLTSYPQSLCRNCRNPVSPSYPPSPAGSIFPANYEHHPLFPSRPGI
jgi:hypothetical protein